ncbi:hypothetical protein AB833_27835 [Chromatiales bacterium (ex Bugula neritina AB1)]|nr:hypothetical protein AB833_27835 [Chromatiales bacterium (ex Bugula neritina AB1)]
MKLSETIGADEPGAYFLGTRGGNAEMMLELLTRALQAHVDFRKGYHPEDPDYLTDAVKKSDGYKEAVKLLEKQHGKVLQELQKSGPFFSPRSIGHMLWDTCVPGMVGYFAAMLYNQNNTAAEASPVTTIMEMLVGNDLCEMLGFNTRPFSVHLPGEKAAPDTSGGKIAGWGHITCDGSVANLEALWAGRNIKFLPVALKNAILGDESLKAAKALEVKLLDGSVAKLTECDNWLLLNLKADDVLELTPRMHDLYGIDPSAISDVLNNYSVQNLGLLEFYKRFLKDINEPPVALAPATKHYSWPKGAAILGIGANNVLSVLVGTDARMDLHNLEQKLQNCVDKKIPVMTVIAVIGSTEESAVDPLDGIIALREKFRGKGLDFTIHADAAWGGYFASMLREGKKRTARVELWRDGMPMSDYVTKQYASIAEIDTVTIDPHKAGYVPYPAGGMCYRNSAMRGTITFTAPVVYHGGADPTVGVYGVEGSKPGAAASAVYLSHRVIRTDKTGYGAILADCMYGAKQFYASMITLNLHDRPFKIVPLCELPAERNGGSAEEIHEQLLFIQQRIVGVSKHDLVRDSEAFELFRQLGQDQTILTYVFNFRKSDGSWNTDIDQLNTMNNGVFDRCSMSPRRVSEDINNTKLIVTSSKFEYQAYGEKFMDYFQGRLGIENPHHKNINFNISTLMNPWLTDTEAGSFAPTWAAIMADEVEAVIAENNLC